MDPIELKWNYFKQNVELLRSYLELTLKVNMFYYAVTGAILTFYFAPGGSPVEKHALAKYVLILPIVLSAALGFVFLWSALLANKLRESIRNSAYELGFKIYPEGIVLVLFCVVFGLVLVFVAAALTVLYCRV